MKKLRKLKKGLAILLSLAMVVGLIPGMGTMKVSAATEIEYSKPNGAESNMKEVYETPKMEIVEFETEDVITTSAIELPFVPCVPKGNE